jgi:hypothetical protein
MRTVKFLSFPLVVLVISSCWAGGIKGEGPVVETSRKVANFNKIENSVGAVVYISKSAEQQEIKIKGQQNILDVLTTKVSGNELSIEFSKNVGNHDRIEIYISIPEVKGLEISGSGKIEVKDSFSSDKLELEISGSGKISGPVSGRNIQGEISGSGDIDVDGESDDAKLTINGSGKLKLNKPVKAAKIEINGSGFVKVEPVDNLDIEINGSGSVEYVGNPSKINQEVNGSGRIRKVN